MSDLQRSLLKSSSLPPMPPLGAGGRRGSGSKGHRKRNDYSPVHWSKYWDQCEDVKHVRGDVFRVYRKGSTGPLLVLLHGGGYGALTWSLFAESISGMVDCQILAFDQRGHGDTNTIDTSDLSADRLAKDVGDVIECVYGDNQPACVLVGHSMGGAIAVHAIVEMHVEAVLGLVVIDVVEGTAMDALSSMQSFLRGRPQNFNSLQHSIEWSIRTGQTRNADAARVSMPSQVKNMLSGTCGTQDIVESEEGAGNEGGDGTCQGRKFQEGTLVASNSIPEESEEDASSENSSFPLPQTINKYSWRINLANTEKFWSGWFIGLSRRFLSCPQAKMLLLAGIDRLDKDLTVGQMQGKFQMQVLPQCGHAVHEDVPDKVAEVLATFLLRHKFTEPIGDFHRTFPAC